MATKNKLRELVTCNFGSEQSIYGTPGAGQEFYALSGSFLFFGQVVADTCLHQFLFSWCPIYITVFRSKLDVKIPTNTQGLFATKPIYKSVDDGEQFIYLNLPNLS